MITSRHFLFFIIICFVSCSVHNKSGPSFQGDERAVARADSMFVAIGGKEAWCRLKSLYIKAEHSEPEMEEPYTSEIWRAIDTFELVIEQQNENFHAKAVISESEGIVRYYDKRDTFRILTAEQLADWAYGHNHNVYVLLHKLSCNPQNYRVEIEEMERLTFYKDSVFEVSFGLDEEMRPALFYQPNRDGSVSGSIFTRWGTDHGLVHSAGGHPLDSNFIYTTEIWEPAELPLKEQFGEGIFEIDPK